MAFPSIYSLSVSHRDDWIVCAHGSHLHKTHKLYAQNGTATYIYYYNKWAYHNNERIKAHSFNARGKR
jgi:hypothetical protein